MNYITPMVIGFILTVAVVTYITLLNHVRHKEIRQKLKDMVDNAERNLETEIELVGKEELLLTNSGKEILSLRKNLKSGVELTQNQVLNYRERGNQNSVFTMIMFAGIIGFMFTLINNAGEWVAQYSIILILPTLLIIANWLIEILARNSKRKTWRVSFVNR